MDKPIPEAVRAIRDVLFRVYMDHDDLMVTTALLHDMAVAVSSLTAAQQQVAPPPEIQFADIVAEWKAGDISAGLAMVMIRRKLDKCYLQPANDYNLGWVAGAKSVEARALEIAAGKTTKQQQGQAVAHPVAWRILWTPQFPETVELTSDGERILKVQALDDPPYIDPLYTAPPSAPVGVEGFSEWAAQSIVAVNRATAAANALAQQPEARGVVDEEMVERARAAYFEAAKVKDGVFTDPSAMHAALTAALTGERNG